MVGAFGTSVTVVTLSKLENDPILPESSRGWTRIVWLPALSAFSAGTVYFQTPFSTGTRSTGLPSMKISTWLTGPSTPPVSVGVLTNVTLSEFDGPVSLVCSRRGSKARMLPLAVGIRLSNMLAEDRLLTPSGEPATPANTAVSPPEGFPADRVNTPDHSANSSGAPSRPRTSQ